MAAVKNKEEDKRPTDTLKPEPVQSVQSCPRDTPKVFCSPSYLFLLHHRGGLQFPNGK
jgi:hypothetical protein